MTYNAYFAIEKQLKLKGFDPDRSELVSEFTKFRKDGLSQLTREEYTGFINWLLERFNLRMVPTGMRPDQDVLNRKRKRVIANMCQAGYVLSSGRPNMNAIEEWVLKQKHKKPFNSLNSRELSELIIAAEGVAKHFIKTAGR